MAEITPIIDGEKLYRSVREQKSDFDEYHYDDDKRLIITLKAFNDREKSPSVDRATLRNNNPEGSKISATDGIVTLLTKDVRSIGNVNTADIVKNEVKKTTKHSVDVIHKPFTENYSHSEVTVNPSFYGNDKKQKRAFKLLKIALARLATQKGWTIVPG